MVEDSTSCVCSHGPEYLIVGGDPGGTAGLSRSRSKNDAWVYMCVPVQPPNKVLAGSKVGPDHHHQAAKFRLQTLSLFRDILHAFRAFRTSVCVLMPRRNCTPVRP